MDLLKMASMMVFHVVIFFMIFLYDKNCIYVYLKFSTEKLDGKDGIKISFFFKYGIQYFDHSKMKKKYV